MPEDRWHYSLAPSTACSDSDKSNESCILNSYPKPVIGRNASSQACQFLERICALHKPRLIVVVTQQFIFFSGAGAIGTCAHYATLLIGVRLGADPVLASALGATVGAVINYGLNYRLVFRSAAAHRQSAPRFAVVAFTSLVLNTALMAVSMWVLGLNYLLAQVAVTFVVLIWNFTLNRLWVFRQDRDVA